MNLEHLNNTHANAARILINRGHNDYPVGELPPDILLDTSFIRFHGNTGISVQLNWRSGRQDGWVMLDVPGIKSTEYDKIKEMFYGKAN